MRKQRTTTLQTPNSVKEEEEEVLWAQRRCSSMDLREAHGGIGWWMEQITMLQLMVEPTSEELDVT